jgi:hypothetical protein
MTSASTIFATQHSAVCVDIGARVLHGPSISLAYLSRSSLRCEGGELSMNTAQHHATIIATLTTLGLALSACTSCPVGTQPVDGVCMRVSKTSADGAAGASSPGEATDQEDPGSANSDGIAGIGRASDAQVAACAGNAGEAACDEQGTLLMCDDHGAAKRIAACMSAELCEAGRSYGKCAACLPGAAKCDGAMLMRCSADASTFAAESDCKSAQLCDQVRGTC